MPPSICKVMSPPPPQDHYSYFLPVLYETTGSMTLLTTPVPGGLPLLPVIAAGLAISSVVGYIAYNLFFHPLRIYPGPKLWAATQFPYTLMFLQGNGPYTISSIHEKYGEIVRVAPNKLSYTHPDAWREIKGHRKTGQGEHGKDKDFYYFLRHSVIGASREDHGRTRRVLAHGFSAKSMQDQMPLISQYIDLFVLRLRGLVQRNNNQPTTVNAVHWFNFTTFDIIGDLAFGAPFDCLENSTTHPWITTMFEMVEQFSTRLTILWYIPKLLNLLLLTRVGMPVRKQTQFATERIEKRLDMAETRNDFVGALIEAKNKEGISLTREEIVHNMRLLILAGSETTATTLSGATYYLCKHPEIQKKLAEEVRGAFESEDEIHMHNVSNIKYLLAVLEETLRAYPPVPTTMPRTCQPGGDIILGKPVPGGTTLDIWDWAMCHDARNFTAPNEFIPERWDAENPRFPEDRRAASQPFSTGPRNCIGKNLAYVEMRLILARLIWNFDLEFADPVKGEKWIHQKCHNLWLKGALDVTLIPVKRD